MIGPDGVLRRQQEIIDKVGWSVIMVMPTDDDQDAPIAYTIGLTAHDYPELVITGLNPRVAHTLLNDLAKRVFDRAERFTNGQRISNLLDGYDAVLVDGTATDKVYPGVAYTLYGEDRVRLQQIVWGRTRRGRSPGSPATPTPRTSSPPSASLSLH